MVHTFNIDGNYYLFDVESSSLHVCDKLTTEVVKKINGEDYDLLGVPEKVIKEIEEEILSLKESGVLYTEMKEEHQNAIITKSLIYFTLWKMYQKTERKKGQN